jgi:hypothetical protein
MNLKLDCASFTLILLYNYGGKFESATKLQKIAFLSIAENGLTPFTDFKWHHYGPYSKELQETVEDLGKQDLVSEEQINRTSYFGDEYSIRRLRLTIKGKRQIEKELSEIDAKDRLALIRTIEQYGDLPLSRILDYVYKAYSPKDLKRE